MLMLHESLEFSIDEEGVINSVDDVEMNILSAVATFMRRNLIRNQGYYECSLPAYSIDEFKVISEWHGSPWKLYAEKCKPQEGSHHNRLLDRLQFPFINKCWRSYGLWRTQR